MSNIYYILILSILGLLYLGYLFYRKIPRKKLLLNTIIVLIVVLLIYLSKGLFASNNLSINADDLKENLTTNDKITTTTTNDKINTTTQTTTTSKLSTKVTTSTTNMTTTTTNENKASNLLTGTTAKGYSVEYRNGAYYIDGYLIANKTYNLTSDWVPTNTYKKITASMDGFCRDCIDKTAYEAWNEMKADAFAIGYNMWIQSGYRSYDYQKDLYNGYVKRKGQVAADKSSARPGSSEHQTGLAFDICVKDSSKTYPCISSDFNDTVPAKWLSNNAHKYGYILRYPKGKTDETGYIHESWHFRYVGKELAKKLYNDGDWITLEDYFGIDSKYSN